MPKGSKGWPIVSDELPRKFELFLWVCLFNVVIPFGICLVDQHFKGADRLGSATIFGIFTGLNVSSIALMFWLAGRLRVTPTAIIWVPLFRRPRFVHFASVRRMREVPNGKVFDLGKRINIPRIGRLRSNGRSMKADRLQIEQWLDAEFAAPSTPSRKARSAALIRGAIYFGLVPAAPLVFTLVFQDRTVSQFESHFGQLSASQEQSLSTCLMLSSLIAAFEIGMAAVNLLRETFRLDAEDAFSWRISKRRWSGFEVNVMIDPPPNHL